MVLGIFGHDINRFAGEHIIAHAAAQVAVGDHSLQVSLRIGNADAAEHFGGHNQQGFLHVGGIAD